ncbi:MAG: MarR family transcriptional regulator [Bacteroidetes bacterium]|nr:MarR family transcriptional regulator [Bacteroidota bacterium]
MQTLEELIKTKPIKDPHQRALLNIVYTGSWLINKMNQALKPFDLTEPQYNVLRILRGQNGSCMNLFEIQNRMVQRMSNVSRLIDKLLEKGLVERNECKSNRRMVEIQITQKGLTLLEDIEPDLQKMIKKSFDNLTKEEAKLVSELLDKFRS